MNAFGGVAHTRVCRLHPARPVDLADQSGGELARDTLRRLTRMGWIAGVAGAIVVFNLVGFLIPIFIDPGERTDLALLNGPLIAMYVVVAGLITMRISRARFNDRVRWLVEGRDPHADEHRLSLSMASDAARLTGWTWGVAGALFFVLDTAVHSWEFGAMVLATVWLGGQTASALDYLLSERLLRPVTARALAERLPDGPVAPGVRRRLAMAWSLGTGVPLFGVLVVAAAGVFKPDVDSSYVAAAVLFLGAVALSVGLLATLMAAKAIAEPITSVQHGLEHVEHGDLDVHVQVDDGSEVGLLQAGFNRMADGLREREQIRDLFGRQVGEDVARAALRDGTRLGGEEREVGAFFVDLVGSTSMAMAMPPTEVVRVLNRFFRVVVEVVEADCGIVNKFEGDAALCVFGAPAPREDPAGDALRSARRLAARLAREVPEVDFGIGISAGVAVAGNVGAEHRFEYTVIGDPVNEAARLSELAKQRPERVLASDSALDRSSEAERSAWAITDRALLRGRSATTGVAHPRG